MFFLAKNYPTYEAPLVGTTVSPPMKQYVPQAWAGNGQSEVFAKEGEETPEGYQRWEKTTMKFFEAFKWLYEYMGDNSTSKVEYDSNGDGSKDAAKEVDKDIDRSVRDFGGVDLLDKASRKSSGTKGYRYKNLSGADVRTSGSGIDPSTDASPTVRDLSDPFGFTGLVRDSAVQETEPDGHVSRPRYIDHAHYQRLLSIGGAQTGIPDLRNDSLVHNEADTDKVSGLHVSTFEAAASFTMTPLITQFEDPSEMIPLVHPTDTNFGEEFMMGLWKDSSWGSKYNTMPKFADYLKMPSRATGVNYDFASQFSTTQTAAADLSTDEQTAISGMRGISYDSGSKVISIDCRLTQANYNIISADTRITAAHKTSITALFNQSRKLIYQYADRPAELSTLQSSFDTGYSSQIINDDVTYEKGIDDFINNTKSAADGSIAWKTTPPAGDPLLSNPYAYLVNDTTKTYVAFMGADGTGGKFAEAKEALKTINFAQKMLYSMLTVSSGIFDLVGGWSGTTGTTVLDTFKNDKKITDSWGESSKVKGISDFHMNILGYVSSYIHGFSYAMNEMVGGYTNGGAAHGGYTCDNYTYMAQSGTQVAGWYKDGIQNADHIADASTAADLTSKAPKTISGGISSVAYGTIEGKSFKNFFNEAYGKLNSVLNADGHCTASTPGRGEIFSKLSCLNMTLFTQLPRLWNTYGDYFASGQQPTMIRHGVGKEDYDKASLDLDGDGTAETTNPYYYLSATATWKQWYGVSYKYMSAKNKGDIWNMLQISRSNSNYARAKAEYKSAKQESDAIEENDKARDDAIAEKRRGEADAAAKAIEAQRKAFEAQLKNSGPKNKK